MMTKISLNNHQAMPVLGLGTYKIGRTDDDVYRAIRSALDIGYRHIDTATLYLNEQAVGKAIRESGIPREELFVTTKLWGSDVLKNNIQGAFAGSLKNMGLDYLDLYLVHWPVKGKLQSTWQQMEEIQRSERVRSIGLSNHQIHHMKEALESATIQPVVNQVELHPYLPQDELRAFCATQNIVVQAWSPLASNKIPLLEESILAQIGKKHGKSPAQVVLRWHLQLGVVPLPKSSNADRQRENFQVFDFELSDQEMQQVNALDRDHRTGMHPDNIEF